MGWEGLMLLELSVSVLPANAMDKLPSRRTLYLLRSFPPDMAEEGRRDEPVQVPSAPRAWIGLCSCGGGWTILGCTSRTRRRGEAGSEEVTICSG